MKFALQICALAVFALSMNPNAAPAAEEGEEETAAGKFRHAVFFKFKDEATPEQIATVEREFKALKDKIDTIVDFEWGTSESVEGLNDDYTHCFLVTFEDKAGLEFYIPHPDHKAFVEILKPILAEVFVFDYTAQD